MNVNPYAAMMSSFSESNYSTINASLRISQELDFITKGLSATVLVNMKSHSNSSYTNTLAPYFYKVMDYTLIPLIRSFSILSYYRKEQIILNRGRSIVILTEPFILMHVLIIIDVLVKTIQFPVC